MLWHSFCSSPSHIMNGMPFNTMQTAFSAESLLSWTCKQNCSHPNAVFFFAIHDMLLTKVRLCNTEALASEAQWVKHKFEVSLGLWTAHHTTTATSILARPTSTDKATS